MSCGFRDAHLPASRPTTSELADAREARRYFGRFLAEMDQRMSYFAALVADFGCHLDLTRHSLRCLEAFMNDHVGSRAITERENDESFGHLPRRLRLTLRLAAGGQTLDEISDSICIDAGYFFGETLRAAYPQLAWTLWKRKTVERHHPVLIGPRQEIPLEPVGIMRTVALRQVDGRGDTSIQALFDTWARLSAERTDQG